MKKKSILSLFLALAMMFSLTVGVVATEVEGDTTIEETIDFDFKKVSVSMKDNLRMNYKLTLPEGVDPKDVTLYVWKGAVEGVDYTNIKKDEQSETRTAVSYTGADGDLSVFQYADITAKDIGTILYARACYTKDGVDVYTRTLRYSVSLYAMELYDRAADEHPDDDEKAQTLQSLCYSILGYGQYAAQYATGDDYSYLGNGISEITIEGGKTADGFTSIKCHSWQPITLIPDADQWTDGESCWLKNGEFYSTDKELTVKANADTYTVAKLADYGENFQLVSNSAKYRSLSLAVAAAASGDTIKLLADATTDCVVLDSGEDAISLTLDLNGHTLSSDVSYPLDIYNASLTVIDSSENGGGSITTTGGHVFYLNSSTSVLRLEAGTFTGVNYVIYAPSGVAHVKSGVEITDADSTEVFVGQGATATFGFDPTNLVDLNQNTVTPNEDGTWTVTSQESTGDEGGEGEVGGEDSEGSLPSVIYFQNDADWANVNMFVYNSGDASHPTWPGTAMTLVKDNVYSCELPTGYDTVIFNNGSAQTADLSIPTDGSNCYTYNSDGAGEWSVYSIPAPDVATDSTYDADVLAFFTNGGTNTLQLTKDASVANGEGYIVIPANANLTLDLCGHTLVGSIDLREGATLTVKDSVGGGKIIDEGGTSNYYIFSSQWDANLVIEGGEFIPSASKPTFDWSSGSVTLKGGTFHENPCATNGVVVGDGYTTGATGEGGIWTVIPMEDPSVPSDGDEAVEPETT